MSGRQRNLYQDLGLTPSVGAEEIKKRYRELVRRYHPDINPNPSAVQKIQVINEAYRVLGDVDLRTQYDAEREFQTLNTRPPASAPTPGAPRAAPPRAPLKDGTARRAPAQESRQEYGFNGFGRTPAPEETRSTVSDASEVRKTVPRPTKAPPTVTVDKLVAEAQMAYIARRYRDAEDLCRKILAVDFDNAIVREILGDTYRMRGAITDAVREYSYAVQFNPRNRNAQAKLERLVGTAARGARPGPTMTRPVTVPFRDRFAGSVHRETLLGVLTVLMAGALCIATLALARNSGLPVTVRVPWLLTLSPNLMAVCLLDGVIGGVLLALYGGVRPVTQELQFGTLTDGGAGDISVSGPIFVVLAAIWFYVSLLSYLALCAVRNRFSVSMLRAYCTALVLIALVTLCYQPLASPGGVFYSAAFAGNVLFPAILMGWALGDRIRIHAYIRSSF